MPVFALVDCNNFYASCERVFNPLLERKPVVVLSNNDGCIIARSNEAKKLGVPMGAPFYTWRALCDKKILYACSSNYALYGDMSRRVMTVLEYFSPEMEVYSIDEAFLRLESFHSQDIVKHATQIRKTVKQWVGMPVSIGIGPTKTLAKIANHIAKKKTREGVFDLRDPLVRERVLPYFPVQDIWGIGSNLTKKLHDLGIKTATDLRDSDLKRMHAAFSVTLARIIRELRGESCLPLEEVQAKKQIVSSRSFGKLLENLEDIEEGLSHFTAIACEKLRRQSSVAKGLYIFLHTNFFNKKEVGYGNGVTLHFPEPTNDTRYIIAMAKKGLGQIFRQGYRYQKAGAILLDLSQQSVKQFDLFTNHNKNEFLMQTLDSVNKKMGKQTVFIGAEGTDRNWQAQCVLRSPRYTTHWDELAKV